MIRSNAMRSDWLAPALLATLGGVVVLASEANAAVLPEHGPLSIVVVSDEVNPNNLPDDLLTQPGDIVAAIGNPQSGINVGRLIDVSSDCIDDATAALEDGVDVLVYFAHRSATACSGQSGQVAFTNAVEQHLEKGGGVVVFHHGIYAWGGKEAILQLLGGVATEIVWQTTEGQNVIAVGGDHFVTSTGIAYPEQRQIAAQAGVPAGSYPSFNNTPDERYPGLRLQTEAGEERTILFVSDYAGTQILGYDLRRPTWAGHVVQYQPGEYQPNALALDGPNFQILANAIFYVGTTQEPVNPGSTDDGPVDPTNDTTTEGGDTTATPSDEADDDTGGTPSEETGDGTGGGTSDPTPGVEDDGGLEPQGCGCHSTRPRTPSGLALLLGLGGLGLVRRRRT